MFWKIKQPHPQIKTKPGHLLIKKIEKQKKTFSLTDGKRFDNEENPLNTNTYIFRNEFIIV